MPIIKVIVNENGEIIIKGEGFNEDECEKYLENIEKKLNLNNTKVELQYENREECKNTIRINLKKEKMKKEKKLSVLNERG